MSSGFWLCSHSRRCASVGSPVVEHKGALRWRSDHNGISRRWIYGAQQNPISMRGLKLLDEAPDLSPFVKSNPVSILMPMKGKQMNHYGHLARQYWAMHAPARLSQLENREAYFQELGESAATQIEQISNQLEKDIPPDLEYLEQVAHLNAIRKEAEEKVLTELVYSTVDPVNPVERLEELHALLPSLELIEASLRQIHDNAQEQARLDGFEETILDPEDQDKTDKLNRLAQLLQTRTNSPQEVSALVKELEMFLTA